MEKDDFNPSSTEHTLNFLIPAEGRFRSHFLVEMKQTQPGKWHVHKQGLSIDGLGETPTAAIQDFKATLLAYYNELTRTQHRLEPSLLRELHFLRTLITE